MFLLSSFHPSPEAPPTLADMERYVQGEMQEKEADAFEASLADDPMLADALEGLRHIEDPKALQRRLKQLNQLNQRRLLARQGIDTRQEERSKRQSRVRPLYVPQMLMAAAAVVLLLFLGVNLYRSFRPSTPDQQMATEGLPSSSAPTAAPLVSPADSAEQESSPSASATSTEAPAIASAERTRPAATPTSADGPPSSPAEPAPPRPTQESRLAPTEPDVQAETAVPRSANFMDMAVGVPDTSGEELALSQATEEKEPHSPAVNPREKREKERETSVRTLSQQRQGVRADQRAKGVPMEAASNQTLMAVARTLHQRQDWEPLQRTLQGVLDANPVQGEALYLMGDSYYRQGKIEDAIPYLMRVLPHQRPAYDQAQWTLVFCAQAQGKHQAALRILQGLAQREGRYRVAAQSLLEQWKE